MTTRLTVADIFDEAMSMIAFHGPIKVIEDGRWLAELRAAEEDWAEDDITLVTVQAEAHAWRTLKFLGLD